MNIAKILLIFIVSLCHCAIPVHAANDPQNATASATATVPATAPTTGDITAPTTPILISPFDGATTNQTRPEFVWRQSSDSDSNTILYTLTLNGVATFLGISSSGNTQKHNFISHIGDNNIYLIPTFDLPEGEYDWSINAYDLSSNTSHSTTWHLTIDETAPFLTLLNLDDRFDHPNLEGNPTFEIRGPKDVSFSLATESWSTISLRLADHSYSYPTNQTGLTTPNIHLLPGLYTVDITSFDHAGLTTTLPSFTLNITESMFSITIPSLPGITPSDQTSISYLLPSFPATITQITSRANLAFYMLILLAVLTSSLLMILWYRQPNILILDKVTNKPYRSLILYHSIPTTRVHSVLSTHKQPIYYSLSPARAYIPHLSRYSTLTIRIGNTTHILSLSTSSRQYVLVI